MADMFDVITENVVLNAKATVLEEAAGTHEGERYVYIVEAAGDTLKKAKDFVVNNKGKLAALAGAAALAGGAAYMHGHPGEFKKLETEVDNGVDKVEGYAKHAGRGVENWLNGNKLVDPKATTKNI